MKVLQLITGMTVGGAESVLADMTDALVARGDEVMLVYMQGELQISPSRPEVKVVGLGMGGAGKLLQGLGKFRKIVNEFKPDVVHAHMYHAIMLARLARLTTPMPYLISTMHAASNRGAKRSIPFRLTDSLTDISTNVSQVAVDSLVEVGAVPAGRMVPVYNGINTDKFVFSQEARDRVRAAFGVGKDTKLLLAVGRLATAKDYPNLFRAVASLKGKIDFKLLVAGDGHLRDELPLIVKELGLSEHVTLLGTRKDVPELMSAADIFVLSSVNEAFGVVLVEAMANGRLVVTTDPGGVREVMGDTGIVVPSRNPDALAQALLKACTLSEEEETSMRLRGQQRALDNFSFNSIIEVWRTMYRDRTKSVATKN